MPSTPWTLDDHMFQLHYTGPMWACQYNQITHKYGTRAHQHGVGCGRHVGWTDMLGAIEVLRQLSAQPLSPTPHAFPPTAIPRTS